MYAPGIGGDHCEQVELVMLLSPGVPISTTLYSSAVLGVANDVYLDNNYTEDNLHASPPRYDMEISKRFHNGGLYPGGTFNYYINYNNKH